MAEKRKNGIRIYEPEEFEGMRKAGQVAAECLDYITPYVKVGVSTGELDDLCREFMIAKGAIPACLGVSWLSEVGLYFNQPCHLSRYSVV